MVAFVSTAATFVRRGTVVSASITEEPSAMNPWIPRIQVSVSFP